MVTRTGGCLCGKVRYEVQGEPLRVGLCHCADCRRESGSAFQTFGIWPTSAFSSSGVLKQFKGRGFCPDCGSRLFNPAGEETEIRIGSLDEAPNNLKPEYELWIVRRETWLHPLPVPQYSGDRQ